MPKLKWPKWFFVAPINLGFMLGFNFVACLFNVLLTFNSSVPILHIILVCVHGFLATRYWRDLDELWAVYVEHFGEVDEDKDQGPV